MSKIADVASSRALVQGVLVGTFMQMSNLGGPIMVTAIDQERDSQGLYNPWFDVTLLSGAVIRVTVEEAP